MLRTPRAAILINKAAGRLEADDPTTALELTTRALEMLDGAETSLARLHTGRAYQVRAEAYLKLNRIDEVVSSYAAAVERLAVDPAYVEHYVRCLHDGAITLLDLGFEQVALSFIERGQQASAGLRGRYKQDFDRLALEVEQVGADSYQDFRVRLETTAARGDGDSRGIQHRLAQAAFEAGRREDIHEAFAILSRLYQEFESVERQVTVLAALCYLPLNILEPVPDTLLRAIESVLLRLPAAAETTIRAEAHVTHAVALWSRGQLEDALEESLRAVALYTAHAWQIESSAVRLMTTEEPSTARYIALLIACDLHDGPLVAELIESARLPALPDTARPNEKVTFLRPVESVDVARRKLGPLHPITVAGTTRLTAYFPKWLALERPIDLDAAVLAVGGEDAWWWGAWLGPEANQVWAVRSPEGQYLCGCSTPKDAESRALLEEALRATPGLGSNEAIQRGPFNRSYATEESFSTQIGVALIPPPIQEAARAVAQATADGSSPLSIVIASNYLSLLPYVLFGIHAESEQPIRLLEVAQCRLSPPAALLTRIQAGDAPGPPYPVSIVCADPTNNLAYADLPGQAEHVLGGTRFREKNGAARPATRANLVSALRSLTNRHAIFAYSGHAGTGDLGPDLGSHLALADVPLTAEEIFTGDEDGSIPFPERILLGACNSAGSGGTGSGEWLGLTAAILFAGAREVIATAWPIWDIPVTRQLDHLLVGALEHDDDVAATLRNAQLRLLQQWRASTADHSTGDLSADTLEPLPLVWAAYNYIGKPSRPDLQSAARGQTSRPGSA